MAYYYVQNDGSANQGGGFDFQLFLKIIAVLFVASKIIKDPLLLVELPLILFSLSFHEYAHARMAVFLGDPTPKLQGRLSLNPMAHLDPLGTLSMMLFRVGWAKPVVVEARNFRNPGRAMASVAMAGPLSNLFLASLAAMLMTVASKFFQTKGLGMLLGIILFRFVMINLALFVFNMLPIRPLDGSRLLDYWLPLKFKMKYGRYLDTLTPIFMIMLLFGAFTPVIIGGIKFSLGLLNLVFPGIGPFIPPILR